uniref:Uncharacterized protein n=1 Tax=Sphaerodactylus townsendi TaxID=933632 RepID=A0ACB8E9P8_9SAUR
MGRPPARRGQTLVSFSTLVPFMGTVREDVRPSSLLRAPSVDQSATCATEICPVTSGSRQARSRGPSEGSSKSSVHVVATSVAVNALKSGPKEALLELGPLHGYLPHANVSEEPASAECIERETAVYTTATVSSGKGMGLREAYNGNGSRH